ncbi:putative signal peptidase [Exidia glandulosa HHB12029]|uniref:Signal peptidase complex catalytic subunit SEC11 n=1 Tax=Exidia glandulosa HHB12029 TaxID=1314781 RepID=A0A165K9S5_EXIGL|nr:putative signal peptidase [Exidia glandulosa HHB12029]
MGEFDKIRKMGVRQFLLQVLNFVGVLASGLMIWKGLGLVCNTESPIVVVLSGSMEPAFFRGDLLFLTNPRETPYMLGDIVVYKIPADRSGAEQIPIVHRILEIHTKPKTQAQMILTKGDNNPTDDIGLYRGLPWLERSHIVGKVRGFLPYVGYATIAMNDFPQLKYALLGGLALMALVQRE